MTRSLDDLVMENTAVLIRLHACVPLNEETIASTLLVFSAIKLFCFWESVWKFKLVKGSK